MSSQFSTKVDELSEEQANDISMYERYAFFMAYEANSSRGEAFAFGSMKDYVRGSAQLMKQKFNTTIGSNLYKLDEANNWMSRIIQTLSRLMIQKAADEGIEVGHQMHAYFLLPMTLTFLSVSYRRDRRRFKGDISWVLSGPTLERIPRRLLSVRR